MTDSAIAAAKEAGQPADVFYAFNLLEVRTANNDFLDAKSRIHLSDSVGTLSFFPVCVKMCKEMVESNQKELVKIMKYVF